MDVTETVNTFLTSIDWSLLLPVLGALLTFVVILVLKRFGEQVASFLALKGANFVRVGDTISLPTATGSIEGSIVKAGLKRVKVDVGAALKYIPTKDFVNGTITVVKGGNDV